MNIRELSVSDLKPYRELRLRGLKEHPDAFGSSYEAESFMSLETFTDRLRATSESPESFILGAFSGELLIGMIGFSRHQGDKVRHIGTIWGMYVVSEQQGKWTGKSLLTEALERIKLMGGIEQVHLGVGTHNERAMSLYASLGFETYGTEKSALFVSGEYFDEYLMALHFKNI